MEFSLVPGRIFNIKVRREKKTARYSLRPVCTGPFSPLPILVLKKKWPGDEVSESVGVRVVVGCEMYECVECVMVLSTGARTCTHTGQQYAAWSE